MYDLAVPNTKPGPCAKCQGRGTYGWGAVVNGVPSKSGTCWSCKGTGRQDRRDIRRNEVYNRHKIVWIARL
jgi:DnaJ-class molecular chaperone